MLKYHQEVAVVAGSFRGHLGVVNSVKDGRCEVVMYGPVHYGVLMLDEQDLQDSEQYFASRNSGF